jgi:hypothetical protein
MSFHTESIHKYTELFDYVNPYYKQEKAKGFFFFGRVRDEPQRSGS